MSSPSVPAALLNGHLLGLLPLVRVEHDCEKERDGDKVRHSCWTVSERQTVGKEELTLGSDLLVKLLGGEQAERDGRLLERRALLMRLDGEETDGGMKVSKTIR